MLIADKHKILKTIYYFFPHNCKWDKFVYKFRKESYYRKRNYRRAKNNQPYENELYAKLSKIFSYYAVTRWTDVEEYDCYQYKILLHRNQEVLDDDVELIGVLGGLKRELRIYFSTLDNFYYYYIRETQYDISMDHWIFRNIFEIPSLLSKEVKCLNDFLESKCYYKVTDEQAQTVIPNIETEYFRGGTVRIFDCLFTQIDGL